MNKNFLLLVLSINLMIGSIYAGTCQNNQFVSYLQDILTAEETNSTLTTAINTELTTYSAGNGVAGTNETQGFCWRQFQTNNTCCTANLMKLLKEFLWARFMRNQQKKPLIVDVFNKGLQAAANCGKPINNQTKDQKGKPAGFFMEEYKKCFGQGLRAQMRYYRGMLCGLCADPGQASKYFSGSNVLVQSTAFDNFTNEMSASLECLQNITANVTALINAQLDASNLTRCAQVKQKLNAVLSNTTAQPCKGQDCKQYCKTNADTSALGDGCSKGLKNDNPVDVAPPATLRRNLEEALEQVLSEPLLFSNNLGNSQRRQLATVSTTLTTTAGQGVDCYVDDPKQEAGINIEGVTPDQNVNAESSTTKSSKLLQFGQLMLLVALIIFSF